MLLAPYRVLDCSDERGQLCGQMLAQLGADVILVEPPGGSRSRRLAPFADVGSAGGTERSLVHQAWNRGKRSIEIAADDPRFDALLAGTDVLIETGGFDVDALLARHPSLIVVSISAFGRTGPRRHWAAADLTVWASSGPLSLAGDPDRPPVPIGVPQAFLHASIEGAGAALIALQERGRSGRGQQIDCSAQQCSAIATQSAVLAAPNGATMHGRSAGGVTLGALDLRLIFPCRDGHVSVSFLFGTAIGPFTRRLMEWIHAEGYCDLATLDKDWLGYGALLISGTETPAEYQRVLGIVERFCLDRTKQELFDEALARRLLIAPCADIADVVESEQLAARDYFDCVDGITYPGQFAKFSSTQRLVLGHAPMLGAHTSAVLAEPPRRPSCPAPNESPRERSLTGLKVLDLMWVMAGPAGSRVLADHGATVIRVDSSKRVETARTLQPFVNDVAGVETSALYGNLNAGKQGISVDISSPEGREVILDLVRWADVVLESFSPKAMRAWGLDYDVLKTVNPGIVMMSSCLFGQTGPTSSMAGYGTMAAAVSGFVAITGWPDRSPCGPYGAYTDYVAPRFASAALLAAIDHQRRTGEGQYIDFAQAEGAIHTLAPAILEWSINGRVAQRHGCSDPNHSPHGVFAGFDGSWLALACADDAQRAALAGVVGSIDDEAIAAWASSRSADDATALLQAVGVPSYPVQNSPECMRDPHLIAREHFLALDHPEVGTMTVEAPRARFSATPGVVTVPGPMIGEHTYDVLTRILGYDDDRFSELLISGALE